MSAENMYFVMNAPNTAPIAIFRYWADADLFRETYYPKAIIETFALEFTDL